MRIRQIRPEFFTDPLTAHLAPAVQVTYIGLWCAADDAGWLDWDTDHLGAILYPYMSVRVRTRLLSDAAVVLMDKGRLIIHDCGCGFLPTLAEHQRIGGNKSFPYLEKHRVHTNMDKSARNVTVGKGKVGNGTSGAAAGADRAAPDFRAAMAAAGLDPSIGKAKPS